MDQPLRGVTQGTSPSTSLASTQSPSFYKGAPEYSPSLLLFLRQLHEAHIKAVEWGSGLNIALGVPDLTTNHLFIVRFSQYQKAQELALLCGLTDCVPKYNEFDQLGRLAQWYTIPDHPLIIGHAPLLLLHDEHVPIDMERTIYQPDYSFWRPEIVEAIRSYINLACLFSKNGARIGAVHRWISGFVLYIICGVKYIPKCDIEGEVCNDPLWQAEGLRCLERLQWAENEAWLYGTLRRLVLGEFDYNDFNCEWWKAVGAR
ncbi:hypothetical protein BCR39DRAFT_363445 [Naematelia encephala]|uniref:Uncharacterized protein n=1 Tax=Naematelia encephala TaxID=71784 RepID=A0A1Y2ALF8_9TREE|nr:hypothetical protein BCR39DRAFT_363445 [Naematelia encephala]